VAERMCALRREELCSNSKRRATVAVKEAVIVLGRRGGIRGRELAAALGLDPSAATRPIGGCSIEGQRER
jgi:DNA-binding MarR family transcriptional regulator